MKVSYAATGSFEEKQKAAIIALAALVRLGTHRQLCSEIHACSPLQHPRQFNSSSAATAQSSEIVIFNVSKHRQAHLVENSESYEANS